MGDPFSPSRSVRHETDLLLQRSVAAVESFAECAAAGRVNLLVYLMLNTTTHIQLFIVYIKQTLACYQTNNERKHGQDLPSLILHWGAFAINLKMLVKFSSAGKSGLGNKRATVFIRWSHIALQKPASQL